MKVFGQYWFLQGLVTACMLVGISTACKDNNDCTPNNGVCTEGKCVCTPDFAGPACASDNPCKGETCSDHGTCEPSEDDTPVIVCTCDTGYTGTKCETGLIAILVIFSSQCMAADQASCAKNPCQNKGVCSVKDKLLFAHVKKGTAEADVKTLTRHPVRRTHVRIKECVALKTNLLFARVKKGGDRCVVADQAACAKNPCQNKGACSIKDKAVVCTYEKGYSGHRCEDKPRCLEDRDCLEGKRCVTKVTPYRCSGTKMSVHILLGTFVTVLAVMNLN
ncbi:neurogenic locus notch homolog protein 1-like isoform X3 [Haliotis rubra]|uniref:neurogenic locus notch homolog protein 1-like isoform X3 n=1 Tax=Haliotis rubra TaxID=36100 RepID=UPI001EE538FB|nr:neurogenic locus notch homolog protein 1-like isoform X3 [Haliotis rubra]